MKKARELLDRYMPQSGNIELKIQPGTGIVGRACEQKKSITTLCTAAGGGTDRPAP